MSLPYTDSGAEVSVGENYRYRLWREWRGGLFRGRGGLTLFIMLNPSTADGSIDDPTIRRCVSFTQSWGHNRLEVVNLFAYRATNPKELLQACSPIGPGNDAYILDAADRADTIVCAWGTMGWIDDRAKDVKSMLSKHKLQCLGLTRGAHPKHPVRLSKQLRLEPFK